MAGIIAFYLEMRIRRAGCVSDRSSREASFGSSRSWLAWKERLEGLGRANVPRGTLGGANVPRGTLGGANVPRGTLGRANVPRGTFDAVDAGGSARNAHVRWKDLPPIGTHGIVRQTAETVNARFVYRFARRKPTALFPFRSLGVRFTRRQTE